MTSAAQDLRPLTVGVVEDSDEDFAVFSRVLGRHVKGASVQRWVRAEPLLAALKEEAEAAIDVMIVDLSLPGIDGCELTRRLRSHEATRVVPVFVLSGSGRQHDIDRCYAAGATGYFKKSGNSDDLRALLDVVLKSAGAGPTAGPGERRGDAHLCVPSPGLKAHPARAWFDAFIAGFAVQGASPSTGR